MNITVIDKPKALSILKPNSKWVWRGDEYSGLEWLDEDQTKPTEQEILDKQAELQADYDSKEYQRKRAAEYPSYGDQMDYIYHNGIDAWKTDMIDPIKAKYPKDNS